jgi:hypothetical protein
MKRILIAAFLCSTFLASAAQAQTKKQPIDLGQKIKTDLENTFTQTSGVKATGDLGFDILKMLDAKLLPDLQYAKGLADANGNKLTSACWQAWMDVITTNETAVKKPDGTAADPPDPHLVTDLERAIDIRNALQPSAPFMVACSPVANLIRTDVTNFIGQVISGGLSLTKLVPLM